MLRLIVFLVLIGVLALGAGWIADQNGVASFIWNGWRIETSLPVVAFAIVALVIAAMIVWALVSLLWHLPARLGERARRRRDARGRATIAAGLIAVGTGEAAKARKLAHKSRKLAAQDPLTLLLEAQAAQLAGDHDNARRAFHAMAAREDTRLLGLRGLFIEAQRKDEPLAALAAAEEAVKIAPSSGWASQALLGFRCAAGDWQGALSVLESNYAAGLIDKTTHHRQRAVLLTAQALDDEMDDRDRARAAVMEAIGLAPTLIPAAVLAAKFHAEDGHVRKAMKVAAGAWKANAHPDLADAYMHVRLGDSARERLARAEALAAMSPAEIEGALAVARAAIDASEYAKARAALAPYIGAPTQRVAMLMAEIERFEHGDTGRSRQWTMRAVRAALDPVWTADGYVSDRWRPVSPLTGRLDAFHWAIPVAALPGAAPAMLAAEAISPAASPESPDRPALAGAAAAPPDAAARVEETSGAADTSAEHQDGPAPVAGSPAQDGAKTDAEVPAPASADPAGGREARPLPDVRSEKPRAAPPLFRDRSDLSGPRPTLPPIIPLVHAPDDPGISDLDGEDEEPESNVNAQPGGWRGALARWVG